MAFSDQEILDGLAEIVSEETGVDASEVTADKTFTDDLDVDSLSMMTIAVTAEDAVLSDWLGRRVELRAATENEGAAPTYEDPGDETPDGPTEWQQWQGATGPFHDSPRIRLSLVSTGTLGSWDRRRFRAKAPCPHRPCSATGCPE